MTIAACVHRAVAVLVDAGFAPDAARIDVAVLGRHLLGWDTAAWLTRQRDDAPAAWGEALMPLVVRRASGEPVAYLTGTREFYGRAFTVTPDVLIPRPETEQIVDLALVRIGETAAADAPVTVVDVGTGSGCLAVTLAAERPHLRVIATDTSTAALHVAAGNAARHDVADRVAYTHGSLTAGTAGARLIVSNPPYIPLTDRDRLMRDVRDFEPATALFGGADGLDVIRALAPDAFRALGGGGTLLIEVGAGQASAVGRLLADNGFTGLATHADLAGIPRIVEGRTPATSV
ncbi:MAG: protein-(glutamine-N5) methyltransferase, release factor-specific [Acidobacteria bacterium SCN 69-37]|nr:MAG: protein-(glutamine-N5) methyltransferase, release factor-specific [Acidobacteria bacterium SCN 69-37]